MNTLMNKGIVEVIPCDSDFAYVLSDNQNFHPTEYKVLQNQNSNEFLKCMKTLYNGKVQIYYLLEGISPLGEIVASLSATDFLTITAELLNSIIAIKGNGFLSCRNIDISVDKIFVEHGTNKVKIVYLPVHKGFFDSDVQFENSLRAKLMTLIQSNSNLKFNRSEEFLKDLFDGSNSLETLVANINNYILTINVEDYITDNTTSLGSLGPCLKISSVSEQEKVEFYVNEGDFVLGKKQGSVDGVIAFNNAISRVHCKISKTEEGFTITDLDSANGTFVNGTRLTPNTPYSLNHGDIVRLANSNFEITIE